MAKEVIDRWVGRIANVWSIWLAVPAVIGLVTGYLSSTIGWINQFGAFGWFSTGLFGALIASAILALIGYWREKSSLAKASQKWSRDVHAINPLDPEFMRRRISIQKLAHPLTGRINSKRMIQCELFGPANIILIGQGLLQSCHFLDCDFVIVRENTRIGNTIVIADSTLIECHLYRCTVFVTQEMYDRDIRPIGGGSLISYERSGQ